MKNFLIAVAFGLAAAASAAPAAPAQPATPAAAAAQPAQPAGLTPACAEKLRAHLEKMKQELALTEAQATALRGEHERFRSAMMTARADHRSAVAKILTPEQMAKMDRKHAEMKQKRMDACEDDEGHDDMPQHKAKH